MGDDAGAVLAGCGKGAGLGGRGGGPGGKGAGVGGSGISEAGAGSGIFVTSSDGMKLSEKGSKAGRGYLLEGMKHLSYPSDLTDKEWRLIAPLLPRASKPGRPRTYAWHASLNAMFYVLRTGC